MKTFRAHLLLAFALLALPGCAFFPAGEMLPPHNQQVTLSSGIPTDIKINRPLFTSRGFTIRFLTDGASPFVPNDKLIITATNTGSNATLLNFGNLHSLHLKPREHGILYSGSASALVEKFNVLEVDSVSSLKFSLLLLGNSKRVINFILSSRPWPTPSL